MTNQDEAAAKQGRLSRQIIGCTGNGPFQEEEIKKIINDDFGVVGDIDIWQHDQVIVVGKTDFDKDYLKESFKIGKTKGFTCRYMSQDDFLNIYLKGDVVYYYIIDERIRNHQGLSYLASLEENWPSHVPVKREKWQVLPPGEYPFPRIQSHIKQLQMNDNTLDIDEERLEFIASLGPSAIYVGTDEFKRYVIFYFSKYGKAVLECPVRGNAVYVIERDWETLSQYTKAELLGDFPDEVKRVIHSGNWRSTLKRTLRNLS